MTDARNQLRAFVERILRMKQEAKAINMDIREIYAEAKDEGYDKTVLGKLVNYVEKRATNAAEVAEADALFDLYLAAYDGEEPHAHAPARTREIIEEFSPETGEVIEPASEADTQSTESVGGSAGRSHSFYGLPTGSPAGISVDTQSPHESGVVAPADVVVPSLAGVEGDEDRQPNSVVPFARKPHDGPVSSTGAPRHKLCLNVDACAGMWSKPCFGCAKAAENGLTHIPHHGDVA